MSAWVGTPGCGGGSKGCQDARLPGVPRHASLWKRQHGVDAGWARQVGEESGKGIALLIGACGACALIPSCKHAAVTLLLPFSVPPWAGARWERLVAWALTPTHLPFAGTCRAGARWERLVAWRSRDAAGRPILLVRVGRAQQLVKASRYADFCSAILTQVGGWVEVGGRWTGGGVGECVCVCWGQARLTLGLVAWLPGTLAACLCPSHPHPPPSA